MKQFCTLLKESFLCIDCLDLEPLEAVAVYDFTSRNTRELSFRKGDVLILHTHLSPDWWEGTFNNQTGLIPQKYIAIQGR